MSESKKGRASQAEVGHRKAEPSKKPFRARSPEIVRLEHAPSILHDGVKVGFPRIGEEIQIDMGSDRILVLKYKGTGRDDDLMFKWVGTVS